MASLMRLRIRTLICTGVLLTSVGPGQQVLAQYHFYSTMQDELHGLAMAHPTLAQLISIGHGWEIVDEVNNRQIWALKISDNVSEEEHEPEVVFVGAHHANEWISVEVPLGIANHLLDNYANDPSIRELVDNKVVWVIPMLNPDGHEFSLPTNSCWRKNRRDNGDGTFGVDLNRNYGYKWGVSGSSGNTNEKTYKGPAPFSEPETRAMRDFLRSRPNVRALVSYHSYSQAVLRPWSYTLNFTAAEPPPSAELMLKDLSDQLRERISAVHGETYKDCLFQTDRLPSGRCGPGHYAASGELTDWVYHELNIPAFTVELRPKEGGGSCRGFELPGAEVKPTIEENIPAALALIHHTQKGNSLIRDYEGDTGEVPSASLSPSGWDRVFWASPDIRSDPAVPIRGQEATITARVHNLRQVPVNNVTVQIWYTDPRITLELPSPKAVKIDEGTISLPANGSAEFSASWSVPTTPNIWGEYHWCVGVVIKHPDDLPVSTHPVFSNNIAIRNFQPASITFGSSALRFEAVNHFSIDADLDVFVSTEGMPEGWRVRLDPDRPRFLRPGERFLGYAEVVVPQDAEAGEALVRIQGALTPRRPGAVNPVGSGIDYRVTFQPAPAERARRGLQHSFYLGFAFPAGSFAEDHNPGSGVGGGLEYMITNGVSVRTLVEHHHFHGDGSGDFSYTDLLLNARAYPANTTWQWFAQGGFGYHWGDPGANDFGLNLGLGLGFPFHSKSSLELGVDGYWIGPGGADRFFLAPKLGVVFQR